MAQPAAKFRDGLLTVTIWGNENEGGKVFFSIDLKRSYKDSAGDWQETSSLDTQDLLKASRLLQQAYDETVNLKQS